jgi:hypothetical protein
VTELETAHQQRDQAEARMAELEEALSRVRATLDHTTSYTRHAGSYGVKTKLEQGALDALTAIPLSMLKLWCHYAYDPLTGAVWKAELARRGET